MAQGGSPGWAPPFLFFQSNLPASGFALPTGLRPFQTFGIFPNEPLRRRADGPPCMVNRAVVGPWQGVSKGVGAVEASAFFRCIFLACHHRVCGESGKRPGGVAAAVPRPGQPAGSPGFRGDFLFPQSVESGSRRRSGSGVCCSPSESNGHRRLLVSLRPVGGSAGIHPFRSPTAMISRGQPQSGSTAIRVRSTSLGSAIRGKSREGRVVNSGSATGDREDGGATWIPPRHFPVGTALARRPQLMGDGQGNLYLSISNGYAEKQERIHLFQSGDDGGTWRPVDVNFPEDQKRGNTAIPKLVVGPGGRACMVWLDATAGRRAVVFSMTTGDFDWSAPVRLNDDRTMSCTEPRLAVQGDSIYVVWNGVKGDRTTLYFRPFSGRWNHLEFGSGGFRPESVVGQELSPTRRQRSCRRLVRIGNTDGPDRSAAPLSCLFACEGLDLSRGRERFPGGGPRCRKVLLRLRPAALAGRMPGGLFQGGSGGFGTDLSGLERRDSSPALRSC